METIEENVPRGQWGKTGCRAIKAQQATKRRRNGRTKYWTVKKSPVIEMLKTRPVAKLFAKPGEEGCDMTTYSTFGVVFVEIR